MFKKSTQKGIIYRVGQKNLEHNIKSCNLKYILSIDFKIYQVLVLSYCRLYTAFQNSTLNKLGEIGLTLWGPSKMKCREFKCDINV